MRGVGSLLLVALAALGSDDERRLDALVDRFCHGTTAVERKAAQDELHHYGTRAWLRFRTLLSHDDPDIRQRARRVWNAVVTGRGRNWKIPTLQTTYDSATGLPLLVREKASGVLMFLVRPGTTEVSGRVLELTAPLYVGMHEVTLAQYGAGRSDLIYFHSKKRANLPVSAITTKDIGKFCKATGLRLPTRTEWAYVYHAGRALDQPRVPVGSTKRNGFGIYEMRGNVAEWCTEERGGPPAYLMGGSFLDNRLAIRAAPNLRGPQIGFRVVREP